jgi:hypothetical protein
MANIILQHINNNYSVLYIGVGCAMPDANIENIKTSPETNQQYPVFLDKIPGKKLIFLIDPRLEEPLYLTDERKIELEFELPGNVKIYSGDNIKIIAVKDNIFWNCMEEEKWVEDYTLLVNIIMRCMDINMKVILQDYTGADTTQLYAKLIPIFNKETLFPNVIFDVTYGDGGCLYHFTPDSLKLTENGDFIQDKFLTMKKLVALNSDNIDHILSHRINIILSELTYKFSRSQSYISYNLKKFEHLFVIYNIECKGVYNIMDIERLLQLLLRDISETFKLELSGDDLFSLIPNRSKFIDVMNRIRYNKRLEIHESL